MAEKIDFRVKHGLAVTNTATIESTATSISSTTGALTVAGGVGIVKDLYVGGIVSATNVITALSGLDIYGSTRFLSTTQSTSYTSGAIVISGGVGIAKNLNVNGNVGITSFTASSSTSTGALTVQGGMGISGDIWVGGTIYGTVLGSISTATNLANGTAGQVPYQTAPGATSFFGPGTDGQFLKSNGASAPSYVDTSTIYAGNAVTATHIRSGVAGDIVYQSGTGTTTFLNIGTAAQILTVNAGATAPTWTTTSTIFVGRSTTATIATEIETKGITPTVNTHYLTFVDANNLTSARELLYTSSTIQFSPTTTGWVGIGTAPSTTYKLSVGGALNATGQIYASASTQATTTATGALRVLGGASVGSNLFVGSSATILNTYASTSSIWGNALVVAGGVGIGKTLLVTGEATFLNNVTFAGTTTYVYSTNTVYTDNIIDLHFPSGAGGTSGVWTVDDGKDIGHIYHHYKPALGGDDHAAFIWRNATDEFQLWHGGIEYMSTGTWNWEASSSTYAFLRAGAITLEHTTASNSTATGALVVKGGVGVGGDLWVGGVIHGIAEVSGTITTASNLLSGQAGQIPYQVAPGETDFFGPGSTGTVLTGNGTGIPTFVTTSSLYVGYAVTSTHLIAGTIGQVPFQSAVGQTSYFGPGTAGQLLVSNGASATGPIFTTTSSIYVGNAGIADKVKVISQTSNASYYLTFVDSNNTTSTDELVYTTSSLVVNPTSGNVGISVASPTAKLDVSGGIRATGITTVTNATAASSTATGALQVSGGVGIGGNLYAGGNGVFTGDLAVNGGDITSTAATFALLNSGVTTANVLGAGTAITVGATTGYTNIRNLTTLTNTTNATSTSTGALSVAGGVGVGGNLYVGGTIYGVFSGTVTGTATTATNLAGGTAGQVPYQSAPGVTAFYGPGTAGQLLVSAGASAPSYTTTSSIYVGNAVTATDIRAGAAGDIVYQAGPGDTTFLTIGTSGYVLTSNGSAPTWAAVSGLTAGQTDAVKIVNELTSSTAQFITFVGTSSGYTGIKTAVSTGLSYIPSTGNLGIGNSTPIYKVDISGGMRVTGITTVTNATAASSTATGALQVIGGAGVGGNLYVGGNGVFTGDLAVNGGDLTSTAATFALLNSGVTTANVLGAGTAITIGATTGYTNIRNLTTLTNTTISTNTTTGALRVEGGIGVGDSIYVKNRVGFVNTSNTSVVYQVFNAVTNSLDTVFA